MDKFTKKLIKILVVYFIILGIFYWVFSTVLMLVHIPSTSMEGTIMKGDILIATRYGIGEDEISRYDILIFKFPDNPDETYIKRVIGLPGETIEVKNGKVYADGIELDDSFIKEPMNRRGDGTYIVPEGCYFFLGDNRNHSLDSRFRKDVPAGNIEGKAKYVIFPFPLKNVQYNG